MARLTPGPPLIALVGATAVGKSEVALDLAERLNGEILNADALQLYRGMDIGTAKLPVGERRGIEHHLLDLLDVHQDASVAAYQRAARAAADRVRAAGRVPIAVGGSGLYVRALTDEIDFPGTDPQVRRRLEETAAEAGPVRLHARLRELDPEAAVHIGPADVRRTIRALEVIELTGRPFSATMPRRVLHRTGTVLVGLHRDRAGLHERIARRTAVMFDAGLVRETGALVERGLRQGTTARRAIGYQQALAVLDGTLTEDAARESTTIATRRLVRRQDTWFHRDPRISWVDASSGDSATVAAAVLAVIRAAAPPQPEG